VAGRRVRNAIKQILVDGGVIPNDAFVVIAGLANTYSDYYTTFGFLSFFFLSFFQNFQCIYFYFRGVSSSKI